MKKIFFLIYIVVFATGAAFAQEVTPVQEIPTPLKSKRGVTILPEYSEWGLGISADPFLGYVGNLMTLAVNGTPGFEFAEHPAGNFINSPAIFGKYIVDENTAYRVRFNVNVASDINKAVVGQDQLTPDPDAPAFVEDWQKNNIKNFVIAAGLEKRRGASRLQGVYGGELVFGLSKVKREYQYGNPISADFNAPTTHNFGGNIVNPAFPSFPVENASVRVKEENFGSSFLIGARGFIGVEYFFAPKISLGGEFGYMFGFGSEGKTVVTTEQWDATSLSIREIKTDVFSGSNDEGFSSIGIGLDNLNGSIHLLFYF